MASVVSIDRRVRRESGLLLREARRGLRRFRTDLPSSVVESVGEHVSALEQARAADDGAAMRREMSILDELVDEHLSHTRKATWREYVESIAVAVLIALVLRAFVVEAFKIPSGSMIPTMQIGDHIFVNKFLYGVRVPFTNSKVATWRGPDRGEVVVFIYPCDREKDYIKRVVAVAGDKVEVRCNQLYINGAPVVQELSENSCSYWDYDERDQEFNGDRSCVRHERSLWGDCQCSRYRERLGDQSFDTVYGALRPKQDERTGDLDFPVRKGYWRWITRKGEQYLEPTCERERAARLARGEDDTGRTDEETRAAAGRVLRERSTAQGCGPAIQYEVPAGHVFVMGDNREKSADSRRWGPVPVKDIKGKALFIWWSSRPDFAGGYQWDRIGKLVH